MNDINQVELRGRLARDPIMRYTPKGTAVTNASIATSRSTTTEFTTIVAWDALAKQLVQDSAKGDVVHVRGRIQSRSWEGQDGQKRYTTEVIVEEIVPTKARAAAPALDDEAAI